MQKTMIFFDFSAVDAAKDRADKIGVNYEAISEETCDFTCDSCIDDIPVTAVKKSALMPET